MEMICRKSIRRKVLLGRPLRRGGGRVMSSLKYLEISMIRISAGAKIKLLKCPKLLVSLKVRSINGAGIKKKR